jgi:hypothetical protein
MINDKKVQNPADCDEICLTNEIYCAPGIAQIAAPYRVKEASAELEGGQRSCIRLSRGRADRVAVSTRAFRDLDRHPVERRLHIRRQLLAQNLIIEIGMQIAEDGAVRLDPFYPAERVGE